ncbi:hypothetical protein G7045_10440 [Acidovorax sp. HDW3]|uniref:hypothetical protein n=1 Tax=Acidovorax sp. HDW3 TaxID=2714923 RepID=UPI0014080039|nr:hypothetical protein [Acidovorax sp. HDW3]QIL44647.1 hypothetical protein G7045_10440 [Acidovorax sp. HDW3]
MATLQDSGRIALAKAIAAQPLYMAYGRGLPAWDATPEPEPTTATTLVDEIGRRLVTAVQYVVPHAGGEIELPDGSRYTASAQPSKWLHARWTFDYADAAGETVREIGVFIGGAMQAGLPAGQRYFDAAQVAQPGDFYTMERVVAFVRSASTRQVQEFVLPF